RLTRAARPASAAAVARAAVAARVPARWKNTAVVTAPAVWPKRRAVASAPPAAPLRCMGAAVTMARLLGDWKKPKPRPQTAIRQAMSRLDAPGRTADSRPRPAAK